MGLMPFRGLPTLADPVGRPPSWQTPEANQFHLAMPASTRPKSWGTSCRSGAGGAASKPASNWRPLSKGIEHEGSGVSGSCRPLTPDCWSHAVRQFPTLAVLGLDDLVGVLVVGHLDLLGV